MIDSLSQSFSRISVRLYFGISGAVFFTIIASLVGWFSFERIVEAQKPINESSIPLMASAFAVAQDSSTLVAAAPLLTTAATHNDLILIAHKIAGNSMLFQKNLSNLIKSEEVERQSEKLRLLGEKLIGSIDEINQSMVKRFEVQERRLQGQQELEKLGSELIRYLVPVIDDQLFYTMTGYRSLESTRVPYTTHFSPETVTHYRHLAGLSADATFIAQLLASAFSVTDPALLEPLRERFEAVSRGSEYRLSKITNPSIRQELEDRFDRLLAIGKGDDSGFKLRIEELGLEKQQQELLLLNRELGQELVAVAEDLIDTARTIADEATNASEATSVTVRNLLILISVSSVIGAILIAWLFVGRSLTERLEMLSYRMIRMAEGELEKPVTIGGRDEVAQMAKALEIFRRNSLESLRLNKVEKLAEELRGKNSELEKVLEELHRAQDQIIMSQKLASLGELTAGVAHEIKNPLNFVINFTEVSEELLEEILEEINKLAEDISKEERNECREIIDEISADLIKNLKTIREHGHRANQIVQSMLMMGRSEGEWEMTNINSLFSKHARLAYHNATISNPDFNLKVEEDFDENICEINVNAQDLGRVFLNAVANSCYATEKKHSQQAELENSESVNEAYEPYIKLSTRLVDDNVELSIHDNGIGMPPEVVEKMFDPFFTTKPTNEGTGLGMSLSSDIIRKHGGSIRVSSEVGKYTDIYMTLPANKTAAADL
ncbi:MAG: ATP-binding protein [Roseovarius sp.]|nr:ATP-binding protein [Roseovarius sp.]